MTTHRRTAAPRYNLKRVFRVRDTLANDTLSEFSGFAPSGEHFDNFVDAACAAIGDVRRQVMWDSLRYIAGSLITPLELKRLSWRLAGNIRRLRDGHAVPPWHVQHELEWMPVQVLSWTPEKAANGKPGSRYALRVLAGTACPMKLSVFWSGGFVGMLSRRVGYSSRWHKFPFGHPSELVNMRLWVLVEPERCRPGIPGFHEVACSSGLLNWNRDIIHKRFRKGWRCPHNYDWRCHTCPIGYLECPAATHRERIIVNEDQTDSGEETDGTGTQPAHGTES